jgi:N12 class adenine-specific DNA methylase
MDESGKAVKAVVDGKASKRNTFEKRVYGNHAANRAANQAEIPSGWLLGQSRHARLLQLVSLRDLLLTQLNHEAENAPDSLIDANRQALFSAYQAFTKAHGLINDPANAALVANMPDGALVLALEFSYRPAVSKARAERIGESPRPSSATPAPILSRRVIVPYTAPEHAASFADALSITLAERGQVDMPRIAALLGKSVPELEQEIRGSDKPLLFHDPETERWESANDYLSGQVRRKLNAARAAGLTANVQALEAIQPEPWGAENVAVLLGSTWAPTFVYEDFIQYLSGRSAKVSFSELSNKFYVRPTGDIVKAKEEEWGADGYDSVELVNALLNNQSIRVAFKDINGKSVLDQEKTTLANLKARAIAKEFTDWVFQDGERRRHLVDLFNDKFNTRVNRQYDGSHLILPGKVPDAVTKMRRHQNNAIWRGIFERFLLLDHAVGAGKTYTAIAIAMERRRMGLSKKPMIIVPNHMVEQFANDAYRLYPGAKVLAAGKTDFDKPRRRRLFAKIATGDFDLVIIAHSSFGFIDIAPATEERFLQAALDDALAAVDEAQAEAEAEADAEGKTLSRKPFGVKEAERLVEKITNQIDKVKGRKDSLLSFEQMGIDHLIVDEEHEFKNLFYSSRLTGVKGMGNKIGSQKATDLYNKVRVLRESPTGAVTFMTGTPISNSAVEMYSMMRYLAAQELKEQGLEHFDAWRAQYVSADAGREPTETGRLKEVVRLGRTWSNMRSLMDLYYSFTDSVDNDAIKRAWAEDHQGAAFPIPKVKGGERQSVVIAPTEAQVAFLGTILHGFDTLPLIKDPYERNKKRLRLMDQARKVSLDVRAIAPGSTSRETGGKLERVAQEVARIYTQWDGDRGTQLVFLDRSVPKAKGDHELIRQYDALLEAQKKALLEDDDDALRRIEDKLERFDSNEIDALRSAQNGNWNAYQQIKDNLIARGIPASEIRFIQEASDDTQKQALFDAVNDGAVRVLIGSTPRMGAGTNVQQRLVGLHHVDVTWKPSDIEQREGRIIRQSNGLLEKYGVDHFEVEILAYATERTIDAKMWSLNASKLKTINGIRKYDGSFVMEFEDEESVSMAELAALASGDPLLLERVKLMSELDKLELVRRQFRRRQSGIADQLDDARRDIARLPARIEQAQADLDMLQAGFATLQEEVAKRRVVVEGVEYAERKAAQQAVLESMQRQQAGDEDAKFAIAVGKRRLTSFDGAINAVMDAMGDADAFAMQLGERQFIGRTNAARELAHTLNQLAETLPAGQAITKVVGSYLGMPIEAMLDHGESALRANLAMVRADGSTLFSTDLERRMEGDYTTQIARWGIDYLAKQSAIAMNPATLNYTRQRLEQAQANLPELERKMTAVFPQQAEMDAKYARLQEVVSQLSTGTHAAMVADDDKAAQVLGRIGQAIGATLDHQLFADVASGAGAKAILERIRADSASEHNRHLAARLLELGLNPLVDFTRLKTTAAQNPQNDYVASYFPPENRISLHELRGAEHNLLHEFVHAATVQAVRANGPATMRMRALYADARRSGQLDGMYGMENLDEFVAEAFSNPRFQAALQSVETTGPFANLWQRFVDLVRRVLGLEAIQRDTLARVLQAGHDLMQENHALASTSDAVINAPTTPPVLYRLSDVLSNAANNIQSVRLPAGHLVSDLFNHSGKVSWWHKTVGTMDNLAKRHPAFAPVYDAVQAFLGDVSRYAVLAADQAPNLLPKLENLGDIIGAKRKMPLTAQDTKAIAAPIFEGTLIWARDENGQAVKLEALAARAKLMSTQEKAHILLQANQINPTQNRAWQRQQPEHYQDIINQRYEDSQLVPGVVWQDEELRELFGLSDARIALYREFRAAIDQSLSHLTISEMVKMGGKEAKPLLESAMAMGDLKQAANLLVQHFTQLAQAMPDQADMHSDTAQRIAQLASRGLDLMQRGYAPLSRFGRFSVYVQQDDEQIYFGLFESQIEAGKMARRMRSQFPQAEVLHGTLSDEAYKLFAWISPETLELFGSMVGLDSQANAASTEVYQTYLKLSKSNRSALKRLIERKGIAGFNEDAGRVLAGFIYSNARLTSGNAHLGEIDEAVSAIPKQQGQLLDAAMQLRDHIRNPQGNSGLMGGLMFAQFLGGSVASAMVNLTQPLTMTLPYLSQFGGIAKAGNRLLAAVRDAARDKTGDKALDAALQWAAEEGIVAPQEVHYLQAQAAGKGVLQAGDGTLAGDVRARASNLQSKIMLGWGKMFAMAELSNRRITFIAAWRTAVEQRLPNPARFAMEAVSQTQGVYNSGNKPRWARGSLGGLALTFKQYSIAYVELLSRMAFAGRPGSAERAAGRRGALYMLAVLFLMSGADGLPFEKNLEDLIDGILQRLGYNFSGKRQKQAFLTDMLGEGGADFVLKGISGLPGMPMDVAGRFGMGNLIPATGLLTKKQSYTSDLGELAGPAGDVAKRAFSATGKALGGDVLDAALEISPQSVRNVAKGIDMLTSGQYKDARGYKVNDVTPLEGIMKMVGFQPNSTANIQDAKGQALNMIAQTRMRSTEIAEHLAQGIASGDVAMQREARAWRDDWNQKNPETPIRIDMPGVAKRVRAMREDVILRTQHTAPKALKMSVRNELGQVRN